MKAIEKTIQRQLFALQDLKYRDFQCKLMPNVAPETVIGVRIPALRTLTKELVQLPEMTEFLQILPHQYYEENNLHGLLIASGHDYNLVVTALDMFLPYVDNWATCELLRPLIFKQHQTELLTEIQRWIQSDHIYTVRFGVEMLMTFYLDTWFDPMYPALVASIQNRAYYVRMMIAWYFATALAKQYHAVLPYIQEQRLDIWTHNKVIQKAVESYRITPEQKAYLRTFRRKKKEGEKV